VKDPGAAAFIVCNFGGPLKILAHLPLPVTDVITTLANTVALLALCIDHLALLLLLRPAHPLLVTPLVLFLSLIRHAPPWASPHSSSGSSQPSCPAPGASVALFLLRPYASPQLGAPRIVTHLLSRTSSFLRAPLPLVLLLPHAFTLFVAQSALSPQIPGFSLPR
jgi:hypothetical protein